MLKKTITYFLVGFTLTLGGTAVSRPEMGGE